MKQFDLDQLLCFFVGKFYYFLIYVCSIYNKWYFFCVLFYDSWDIVSFLIFCIFLLWMQR